MRVQLPVSSELLPVKQPLTSVHCQCNTLQKLLQLYSTLLSWLWIIAAGAGTDWHVIGGRPAASVYILATCRQAVVSATVVMLQNGITESFQTHSALQ